MIRYEKEDTVLLFKLEHATSLSKQYLFHSNRRGSNSPEKMAFVLQLFKVVQCLQKQITVTNFIQSFQLEDGGKSGKKKTGEPCRSYFHSNLSRAAFINE